MYTFQIIACITYSLIEVKFFNPNHHCIAIKCMAMLTATVVNGIIMLSASKVKVSMRADATAVSWTTSLCMSKKNVNRQQLTVEFHTNLDAVIKNTTGV